MAVLECKALTKMYGNKKALENLTVNFEKGRIVGLLGPNGSGKSTLMKLASGLLVPTGGSVLINGQMPSAETKRCVAYLPERTYLPATMRVTEAIDFFRDFYHDFDSVKALSMLSDLKISPADKLSSMSKGTREKV